MLLTSFVVVTLLASIATLSLFSHTQNLYISEPVHGFSLWLVRWTHFFTLTLSLLYPLLFPRSFDAIYMIAVIAMIISWYTFKGECILSYAEKKILDPSYEMGSQVDVHPYIDLLAHDYKDGTWVFLGLMMMTVFIFVSTRFIQANLQVSYQYPAYALLCVIVVFHFTSVTKRLHSDAV